VPLAFLALAGMGATLFHQPLNRVPHALLVLTCALVLVPGQVLADAHIRDYARVVLPVQLGLRSLLNYSFVFPGTAALVLALVAIGLRRSLAGVAIALAGLVVMAIQVYPAQPYALAEHCYPARTAFPSITEGAAFISSLGVTQVSGGLWYPSGEALQWDAECPAVPLERMAFSMMHAGLVRPLGTSDQFPLDRLKTADAVSLKAFFIVSRQETAAIYTQQMRAVTGDAGSFEGLPLKVLATGTDDRWVVQAFRHR
jgi:hypothetical protein